MKVINTIRANREHITRLILSIVVLMIGLWFMLGGVTPPAAEFLHAELLKDILLNVTSVMAIVGGVLGFVGLKFERAAKAGLMLMFIALLYFAILSGIIHGLGTVRWITYSGFALLVADEFLRIGVTKDWRMGEFTDTNHLDTG